MIAGFNTIEGGQFYFGDNLINDLPAHMRDIGMVFQNYAIFPHLTVKENVGYGLKARKLPKEQIDAKVAAALKLVQFPTWLRGSPTSFPAVSNGSLWQEPL